MGEVDDADSDREEAEQEAEGRLGQARLHECSEDGVSAFAANDGPFDEPQPDGQQHDGSKQPGVGVTAGFATCSTSSWMGSKNTPHRRHPRALSQSR